MNKQICSLLLLLGYSISWCAADDVFNEACAQDTVLKSGDIPYPAFIPETREKHGGEASNEARRWLAYHPKEKPYVAIAAAFDPTNVKDKQSAFYRVREFPGGIMIALVTGKWGNDALGEVLRNFLNSIDSDAVCADARHSEERLGKNMEQRASMFGKEIIEQEDTMLECGNEEEYKVAFASQWQRKPVSMHLVVAAAWCDLIAKDTQRHCRLMCWMPHEPYDEPTRPQETIAVQDRFINPMRYDALRPDCGMLFQRSGVLEPSDRQYRQLLKPQDIICMTRAVGEHMKGSPEHAHHIWMNVDLKALEQAAKESMPAEWLQKCNADAKELSNDFLAYQSALQPIVNAALTSYCTQHLSGFAQAEKAIERLKPLLIDVLVEYRKTEFKSFSEVTSYERFDQEAFAIFKQKCAHSILAEKCNGMSIIHFLLNAKEVLASQL